jgi:hypothetical protein
MDLGTQEGETQEAGLKRQRSAYRCKHEHPVVLERMFELVGFDAVRVAADCTALPVPILLGANSSVV